METTFHPSLTLVPSLANCSLSLCTLSLTESPPITHPNLPFLFLAAQSEVLPLYRFLYWRSFSLWNPNFPVFILTYCVLCNYMWYVVMTLFLLYRVGAHNAFLSEFWGGSDGLSLRFIISSPTWPVLCFSVMSDLNLDNPGFQSLGAPTPAPPPFIRFFIGLRHRPRRSSGRLGGGSG